MNGSRKRESGAPSIGRIVFTATMTTLLAATLATASTSVTEPSLAAVQVPTIGDLSSGNFGCTVEHLAAVSERQQRIAEAPTVEEARDLALSPVHAAQRALRLARFVAPSSESMAAAREKLDGFEVRVQEHETPSGVASEFGRLLNSNVNSGNMMQVADLSVQNANVRGPGNCHYTTGEIIAIVIGFLLFIIPGIILLLVLC